MTKFIYFSVVAAFLCGNLFKFSLFSPDIKISPLDFVIFSLGIYILISNFNHIREKLLIYKHIVKFIVIFTFISLLSLVLVGSHFGPTATLVGSLYIFRWIVYTGFFLLVGFYFSPADSWRLLLTLGLGSVALGLAQYFLFPDIRSLAVIQWDPHYYRVVGTFLDPGFTGLIFVFTLVSLTLKPFKSTFINFLTWGLTYSALALTYSRSSYLAFLVAFAYLAKVRKSWLFFVGIVVLSVLTLYILPRASGGEGVHLERTSSLEARLVNWQRSLVIFRDHPVLGVGFNTYRYAQRSYGFVDSPNWLLSHSDAGADSSLLFVAATTGLIGLVSYLYYLKSVYSQSTTNYELRTVVVALLAHSLFLNSLFYPAVMLWLTILLTVNKLPSAPYRCDFPSDQ